MTFIPPTEEQIAEALGDIAQLSRDIQKALTNRISESFASIPEPDYWGWLNQRQEYGQTFKSFEQITSKAIPHSTFKTIYIQPIGSFEHPRAPPLELIGEFAQAFFFGCDVKILPIVDFTESMPNRINSGTKQIQYQTKGLFEYLAHTRNQRNTREELLCVAVTMADIYPDETYNFVYGQARSADSYGVYSFSRLDPLFPMPPHKSMNVKLTDTHRTIILRRCVKILLHEICHLFGLKHCIYYLCLMNGANHAVEMDQQPLFVCPVCLRKLQSSLQFNIEQMYRKFADLCETHNLDCERDWYRKRLDCISIQ
ncbi:unnamed protein product [Rotaria sordida]|uniref:Archaemetzincin-2 n=1 Tax=Rotaria sordida TaxID=392033 RepID=A0A815BN90_9BILA|nr:unnamed protein product [Rotaria sordida]CAF1288083.1 unnamed protein product [Rotaria sordida]CAF1318508.1 unnamed protein product [Rotaria sordida]CAF3723728.1 unnamed protein product [Rotaria sordida]CAF3788564.1 unnamed protein product [Rotaria sordida]